MKLEEMKVENWESDLKRMTKIYRSVDSIPKFEEAQRLFGEFGKNWTTWIYRYIIPKKKYKEEETYYAKFVRESAWTALLSISGIFPTAWDFKTKPYKYIPSLEELERKKSSHIQKYQKAFRKAFRDIRAY